MMDEFLQIKSGKNGVKLVIVDTATAMWKGKPFKSLSPFERRKFDNAIYFREIQEHDVEIVYK